VDIAIMMGESPGRFMTEFANLIDVKVDIAENILLQKGEVLVWRKDQNAAGEKRHARHAAAAA
jgi:hypothetical protein